VLKNYVLPSDAAIANPKGRRVSAVRKRHAGTGDGIRALGRVYSAVFTVILTGAFLATGEAAHLINAGVRGLTFQISAPGLTDRQRDFLKKHTFGREDTLHAFFNETGLSRISYDTRMVLHQAFMKSFR